MLPAKPPHAGRETVVNLNTNSAQAQPPKEEAKNIEPSNITVQIKKSIFAGRQYASKRPRHTMHTFARRME